MNVRSEMFASQGEDNKIKLQLFLCMAEVVENKFKLRIYSLVKKDYWLNTVQQSCVASHSSQF